MAFVYDLPSDGSTRFSKASKSILYACRFPFCFSFEFRLLLLVDARVNLGCLATFAFAIAGVGFVELIVSKNCTSSTADSYSFRICSRWRTSSSAARRFETLSGLRGQRFKTSILKSSKEAGPCLTIPKTCFDEGRARPHTLLPKSFESRSNLVQAFCRCDLYICTSRRQARRCISMCLVLYC